MNVNEEIFKRYRPEKKLEMIKNFTHAELFGITKKTILRIIKEVGEGEASKERSKFKRLPLENRVGNSWNSVVETIYNWKKDEVYMEVYIQGDDTDTTDTCRIDDFINVRYETVTCAKLHEYFRDGYEHTMVANYNRDDRAKVIREILNTYVHRKYHV